MGPARHTGTIDVILNVDETAAERKDVGIIRAGSSLSVAEREAPDYTCERHLPDTGL